MPNLSGAVGKGGDNQPADVKLVQQLLRKFAQGPGGKELEVSADGKAGKATLKAIEVFQKQVAGLSRPDGLVEPGGRTWKALNAAPPKPKESPDKGKDGAAKGKPADPKLLSGAGWWRANEGKYPNSDSVSDLASSFQNGVKAFIGALRNAGAKVKVASTLRNKDRAFLMHWSWMVSRGKVAPANVPSNSAIRIVWDHGDPKASIQGARQMVELFAIRYQPALTSRHIEGKAIDMDISWSGTIEVLGKDGKKVSISKPNNGADNTELHKLGAGYGVIKNTDDPPHWSTDGR